MTYDEAVHSPIPANVTATSLRRTRFDQIDIFRGIAVIGVVLSHAVDGLLGAGLLAPGAALWLFNNWMYAFRMPAIALVLGLFISSGMR